jgi:hypothetical protein
VTWETFRDAVLAAVEGCLSAELLAVTPVNWADLPREFGGSRLLLSNVSSVESFVREGDVDDAGISSISDEVVQIVAESQHNSSDVDARSLLERVRLGLRRKTIEDQLAEAGLVLIGIPMAPKNVSFPSGNRRVSAWAIDVTFRTVFSLAADPADDFGLIEHVTLSGVVEDPDGDEVTVDEFTVDDPELES